MIIKDCRLGGLHTAKACFPQFEGWEPECAAWSGSGEGPLLICTQVLLGCVLTCLKEDKRALWGLYKSMNPIHEGSSLTTKSLPKGLTS